MKKILLTILFFIPSIYAENILDYSDQFFKEYKNKTYQSLKIENKENKIKVTTFSYNYIWIKSDRIIFIKNKTPIGVWLKKDLVISKIENKLIIKSEKGNMGLIIDKELMIIHIQFKDSILELILVEIDLWTIFNLPDPE